MCAAGQYNYQTNVQVSISHQYLEDSGLTHSQLELAVFEALKQVRHPVTGEVLELPSGPIVMVSDDRTPVSMY